MRPRLGCRHGVAEALRRCVLALGRLVDDRCRGPVRPLERPPAGPGDAAARGEAPNNPKAECSTAANGYERTDPVQRPLPQLLRSAAVDRVRERYVPEVRLPFVGEAEHPIHDGQIVEDHDDRAKTIDAKAVHFERA